MKKLTFTFFILYALGVFSQEPIANKKDMCQLLSEMSEKDQLHRKGDILGGSFGATNPYSKSEIDSVWSLQIKIDNNNTEQLLALIKKHGWLSDERIDCPKLNIWIIFRHSQEKYFNDISELIETERESGRLSEWYYKLINNHLNGRPRD